MEVNSLSAIKCVLFALIVSTIACAQRYDPQSFSAMKWRLIGPQRAGRVTAVAGISGNAAVYYFERWRKINESNIPQLNQELLKQKLASLAIVTVAKQPVCAN